MSVAPVNADTVVSISPYNGSKSFVASPKLTTHQRLNGWHSYGDGMGAWGRMITNGTNLKPIVKLGDTSGTDFLDVAGADFDANQTIGFSHQFIIPQKGESVAIMIFNQVRKSDFGSFKLCLQWWCPNWRQR